MLYKAKLFPAPFLPLSRLPWASTSWRRSGSGTWNPGTQQEQPPGGSNTPQGPHVVCTKQAEAEMTQNSWLIFGVFTPGPTGKAPKVGTGDACHPSPPRDPHPPSGGFLTPWGQVPGWGGGTYSIPAGACFVLWAMGSGGGAQSKTLRDKTGGVTGALGATKVTGQAPPYPMDQASPCSTPSLQAPMAAPPQPPSTPRPPPAPLGPLQAPQQLQHPPSTS